MEKRDQHRPFADHLRLVPAEIFVQRRLLDLENHVGRREQTRNIFDNVRPDAAVLFVGPQGPFARRRLNEHFKSHRDVLLDRFRHAATRASWTRISLGTARIMWGSSFGRRCLRSGTRSYTDSRATVS